MSSFKIDLKRALVSKGFIFSVLIGLVVIFFSMAIEPIRNAIILNYSNAPDLTPASKSILIGNCLNEVTLWDFGNHFFFLIIPIICCIPFANKHFIDKRSGFNKFQIIRTSYRKYILSKILTTFISGFLCIFTISNILLLIIVTVNSGNSFRSLFFNNTFLSTLSKDNFILFVFVYNIICSFMGGVYAVFGLCISTFVDNIIIQLAAPFLLYYVGSYVVSIIASQLFAPIIVTTFYATPGARYYHIFPQLILLLMLSSIVFYKRTYGGQVYE